MFSNESARTRTADVRRAIHNRGVRTPAADVRHPSRIEHGTEAQQAEVGTDVAFDHGSSRVAG